MNTNNQTGRNISLIVGAYFILKSVINLILGGGVSDIVIAVAEAVALYTGLMYFELCCCSSCGAYSNYTPSCKHKSFYR